ncbi:MAG TPA: hypothetical protein VFO40_14030, partial [Chthoniobacterales bacterium]|nr:hypothetical protein [Chthoniobacterales bacterium]
MRAYLCILGNALILAGCASPYVEVWHVHPHLTGAPGVGILAAAEQAMKKAMHEEHGKALVALADCLTALQAESRELEHDPRNATAVRDYNFGIARIFQIVHDAKLAWSAPLTIPSPAGDFELTHKPDPRPEWNPALYEFTPADEFDVGGKYVTERTTRFGIGAPIVAVERERKNRRDDFAPSRIFYSVTVVAHFNGRRCVLSFEDPLARETVAFNGRTVPLAADFTVPLAVMLQQSDPKKHEFSRLLNPEKYAHTA